MGGRDGCAAPESVHQQRVQTARLRPRQPLSLRQLCRQIESCNTAPEPGDEVPVAETPVAAEPEPTPEQPATVAADTQQTPDAATQEAPAKKKAGRVKKAPVAKEASPKTARAGSKTETVLALMKQPGGTTLKAIMEVTRWQAHSVRGFISGTLGKKMGLTVVSAKGDNGERSYSITS